MKKISIAVPCYNEVGNVREMAEALTKVMQGLPYDYEIVFTDNCSTDGTKDILRELAAKDTRIKVLMNNRNYGGDGRSWNNTSQYLSGDAIIVIACDFQDPPELIPEFIKWWEQGNKVVCGQKTGSEEGKIKYTFRSLYYKIIKSVADTPQYEHISGIVLLDQEVLFEFLKADYDFYLRFALADMGYQIKMIPYKQRERKSGKSHHNIWSYLNFAINSMIITSGAPMRLMTITGFVMSIVSFVIGCIYLALKILFWNDLSLGNIPIGIGMLFLGSIQLFCLGILGEYIRAILRKVTNRPDVILSETINIQGKYNDRNC